MLTLAGWEKWKINSALWTTSPLRWWILSLNFSLPIQTSTTKEDADTMIGSSWAVESKLLSCSMKSNKKTQFNSTQSSNYQLSRVLCPCWGISLLPDGKLIFSSFSASPQRLKSMANDERQKVIFLFYHHLRLFFKSLIILRAFIDDFFLPVFPALSWISRTASRLSWLLSWRKRKIWFNLWGWGVGVISDNRHSYNNWQLIHHLIIVAVVEPLRGARRSPTSLIKLTEEENGKFIFHSQHKFALLCVSHEN